MDVSSAFDAEIGSKCFSSLECLQDALSKFSRTYGVKFKASNSLRYNEGDPRKRTLVYTMATFSCVLKRSHACTSFFRVEVRKNALQVVEREMLHNHEKVICESEPVVDLTEQFNEFFGKAKLGSFLEVMTKVKSFEEATGSEFRVGRSDLFKEGEKEREIYRYRRITYECVHYGTRKSLSKCTSEGRSCRLGCMAKFDVRYTPEGLRVSAVVMKHNHHVSASMTRLYRRKSTPHINRRNAEALTNHKPEVETLVHSNQGATGSTTGKREPLSRNCSDKRGREEETSPPKRLATEAWVAVNTNGQPNRRKSNPAAEDPSSTAPPHPHWLTNPVSLLSNTLFPEPLTTGSTADTTATTNPTTEGGGETGQCRLKNTFTVAERRLVLSGKMQRILDKACHGGARRFGQCLRLLESLEDCWTKEDSMLF